MILNKILKIIFIDKSNLITFIHNNFWSRLFIFITIFLVILASLSIWGANFLERIVDPLKFVKDNDAIIEIYPEVNKERTDSKLEIIKNYLNVNKNVLEYKTVSNSELQELLKDWTSILNNLSNFSLPIIINIKLDPKTNFSVNDLQLALNQKVNGVYVTAEKSLAGKLTSSINISRMLILLIPIVLFFIVFIVILFTTVGLVYTQRESIAVLSFLGAPYGAVAKEFAVWCFKRSFKGCILGAIISLILVEIFAIILNIGWFILPSSTTLMLMVLILVLIPLEATIIAFFWVRRVISWVV